VTGLALKLFLGHLRKHAVEVLLCLLGVTLGVAVVVGIDLAVAASVRSFEKGVNALADRATHAVVHDQGALRDEDFIELKRRLPTARVAPILDRRVLVGRANDANLSARVFGADVFSERAMRSFTQVDASIAQDTLDRFLTQPGQVVLVDALAARLGVKAGDTFTVLAGAGPKTVTVAGLVSPQGPAKEQLADVIIADLATAQELLDALGRLDRIDAVLTGAAEIDALTAALPPGLSLRTTDDRANQLAELIGAYQLNLFALSLMASFVAVFIVYNAMLLSVQQRLDSLAILRCLGASRGQLGSIYLIEALLFAALGAAFGLLGGWGLAHWLVGLVSGTINELYAQVRPGRVELTGLVVAKGIGVSFAAALVGAAVPLWRASATPPVSVLRRSDNARRAGGAAVIAACVGVGILAVLPVVYLLPGESPVAGFAIALGLALGAAIACPLLTRGVCAVLSVVARRMQSIPLQTAAGGVGRSLGIAGVAVAAMMLAGSMSIGIQTMVGCFRGALSSWMDQRFRFDLFVAPQLLIDHKIDAPLPPDAEAWVRSRPEVAAAVVYRLKDVRSDGRPLQIVATEAATLLNLGVLPMKASLPSSELFDVQRDVLASEPLAFRLKLNPGDTIALDTPSGRRPFRVHGVYYDFGSERGQVLMDRATYADAYRDAQITSMHVRLKPGTTPADVGAGWQRELGAAKLPIVVQNYAGLKRDVTAIFDRTFRITDVLAWLAGGVAFCGLAGALLALSLARRREYAILASLGMSLRQAAVRVVCEGLIIALLASAVAIAAGTVLAYVLSYVIQYRSFGWSIPTSPQPRYWVEAVVVAVIAALLAAIYPIVSLKRSPPAAGLRVG
jgi:putative ABC transport system permease protein